MAGSIISKLLTDFFNEIGHFLPTHYLYHLRLAYGSQPGADWFVETARQHSIKAPLK
jgi:hypothetical protein